MSKPSSLPQLSLKNPSKNTTNFLSLKKITINCENSILNDNLAKTIPTATIVQDKYIIYLDALNQLRSGLQEISKNLCAQGSDLTPRIALLIEKMTFKLSVTRLHAGNRFTDAMQELLDDGVTKLSMLVNANVIVLLDDDFLQHDGTVPSNARHATKTTTANPTTGKPTPLLPSTVFTKNEPFDIHKLPSDVQIDSDHIKIPLPFSPLLQ
jgi:hypothetical protein